MRSDRPTPPASSAPPRILIPLVLAGLLWSCGGEQPRDGSSGPAGGISEDTTAPSSARESSPGPSITLPRRNRSIDVSSLGHTVGSPDAPIQVIEFSDFGCGYCRKFHMETYPTIHEEYVETGKVAWKYIPYVLGIFPNGVESARIGECAIRQGGFPRYSQRLFQDQDAWKEESEPLDVFVRLAREEGLDAERLRTCYEERRPEARVQQNIEIGRRVGIRGTPTFLVQGQLVSGALPLEAFREIFDGILARGDGTGNSTQEGDE